MMARAFLVVTVALLAGCFGPPPLPAEVPTWSVGDAWTYALSTHDPQANETTRSTPTFRVAGEDVVRGLPVYVVEVRSAQGAPIRNVTYTRSGLNQIDAAGEIRNLDFPLEVGKRWSQERQYRNGNATVSVEVVEVVRALAVPAGTFDAFRVVSRVSLVQTSGASSNLSLELFFAPEAKNTVLEIQSDADTGRTVSRLELQEFSLV